MIAVRRVLAAVTAAGVVLTAAACSGGSSSGTPSTPSSGTASPSASGSPTGGSSSSGTAASSSATSTPTSAPASTPASTPTGGGIDVTVPSVPQTTLPPVPLSSPARSGAVTIALRSLESVQGQAEGAGQIAGPAVRVTVTVTNGSSAAVPLTEVVVDLRDSTGGSADPLSGPGAAPFSGTVAPGATAQGVYVFGVATDQRSPVRVIVSYLPGTPTAVFTGSV